MATMRINFCQHSEALEFRHRQKARMGLLRIIVAERMITQQPVIKIIHRYMK